VTEGAIEKSSRRQLDKRAVRVWQVRGLAIWGPLLLLSLCFAWLANDVSAFTRSAAWLGAGIVAFSGILTLTLHQAARYEALRYRLDDHTLRIWRGVFWRHEIVIPLATVQHVDIKRGPLMRRYGVTCVEIHTAATKESSITIEGLSADDARALCDALTAGRRPAPP
jgi:membrane protein YdbS with pleckstrin-like domain